MMGLVEIIIPRCVISGRLMSRGPCVEQFVTILAYTTNMQHTPVCTTVYVVNALALEGLCVCVCESNRLNL